MSNIQIYYIKNIILSNNIILTKKEYNKIIDSFINLSNKLEEFMNKILFNYYIFLHITEDYLPDDDEIQLYNIIYTFRNIIMNINKDLYKLLYIPFDKKFISYQVIKKIDYIFDLTLK